MLLLGVTMMMGRRLMMMRRWRTMSSWCCTFYFLEFFSLFGVLMPKGEKIIISINFSF
jgi:hypothetical protein